MFCKCRGDPLRSPVEMNTHEFELEVKMKILMFLLGLVAAQVGFVGIVMYQAKNISTSLWDITKYTLMVTPLLILINILVNMVTNFGNKIFNNLAFTSIANTMMGVIVAMILSAIVFKEGITVKAIIGCVFLFIGVILIGLK